MRRFTELAALAASCTALALAAPVHADGNDSLFISLLDKTNVAYPSARDAIEWAQASCINLRKGEAVGDAINGIVKFGSYSAGDAGKIVRAASLVYCPDQDGKVEAWADGVFAGSGGR